MGIRLVEPTLEQALTAAAQDGPLSFQDWTCYFLAKKNGWVCVTNDGPLRRVCASAGIPLMWGIELLCMLVESDGLPLDTFKVYVQKIQKGNSFITDAIVERALHRLGID